MMTLSDDPSAATDPAAAGGGTQPVSDSSGQVSPPTSNPSAAPRRVLAQLVDTEVQLSIAEARLAAHREAQAKLLRRRNIVGYALTCAIILLIEYLLYYWQLLATQPLALVFGLSLFLIILFPLLYTSEHQAAIQRLSLESRELREKQQIIESFVAAGLDVPTITSNAESSPVFSSGLKESYFDRIVSINLDNLSKYLTAYYNLVQLHTDKSFNAARVAGIMGFLLISAGLIVGYVKTDAPQPVTYIATGAGVFTEFIAGVFFYLYNRTVRQLKDYHDSLINVQNVFLAMTLVADTADPKLKADLVSQLLTFLTDRNAERRSPRADRPVDDGLSRRTTSGTT
jgi:hypothetical protein